MYDSYNFIHWEIMHLFSSTIFSLYLKTILDLLFFSLQMLNCTFGGKQKKDDKHFKQTMKFPKLMFDFFF